MRHSFKDLVKLSIKNPALYRAELERLSVQDPERDFRRLPKNCSFSLS